MWSNLRLDEERVWTQLGCLHLTHYTWPSEGTVKKWQCVLYKDRTYYTQLLLLYDNIQCFTINTRIYVYIQIKINIRRFRKYASRYQVSRIINFSISSKVEMISVNTPQEVNTRSPLNFLESVHKMAYSHNSMGLNPLINWPVCCFDCCWFNFNHSLCVRM